MIKNYLKIVLRNLQRNKIYSLLNVTGLSVGMAVAIVIGLWIWDELSFDKYHDNYDRIAMVKQNLTNNGETTTQSAIPYPLAAELRNKYGSNFKYVVLSTNPGDRILSAGEKKIMQRSIYMEPDGPELFTLKMIKGRRTGLKELSSVMLSRSAAKAYFGNEDPMNRSMKINNEIDVQVTGVYEDIPENSMLAGTQSISPWQLFFNNMDWIKNASDPWRPNAFNIFTQLADNTDAAVVSAKIKDSKLNNINKELQKKKPEIFLQSMSKWHLFADFKNGVNVGGAIKYVWMFGVIGIFVLLLACINFMNLSTARSEKRAREVGIRKAIGSLRTQLILQFFIESLVMVFLSFAIAVLLALLILPFFNSISGKNMSMPWGNIYFWLIAVGFTLFTGIIAGSYPAFYLSSFQPVKILKGTFKAGRFAALPRRVLVVTQFAISVTMIIGTLIVFRQIQFSKNRPIGFTNNGIVTLPMNTSEIHDHFETVKTELEKTGAVVAVAESASPLTGIWSSTSGISWQGKDPNLAVDFLAERISMDYPKLVGWKMAAGRNFSKDFPSDSAAIILNEAAVKFMGLKNPLGENIRWFDETVTVIGVSKDMVMSSPYEPVRPTIFTLSNEYQSFVSAKLNPMKSPHQSVAAIEKVFKKFNPSQPFTYSFSDEDYAKKFGNEERIGKLAGFFAILAIFISCLGLFGMASFIAEQRVKEIGVRKVLGASVFNVWQLLSKDFLVLVFISLLIAIPTAWYFMHNWLQSYTYRTALSWWIFLIAGVGALLITVLTVSFQAIKAAVANPVKSLRTE
ncbi:ABC transporter permease [Ferruginibacter sp.]|nr:FtsX-like permease family protein [Ferruginibacter sp.]